MKKSKSSRRINFMADRECQAAIRAITRTIGAGNSSEAIRRAIIAAAVAQAQQEAQK